MDLNSYNLVNAPVLPECFVSIVIPVRDEAEHLIANLDAFANQIDLQNAALDPKLFEIIVLANNCSDDSAALTRDWKNRNAPVNLHVVEMNFPPENSNVGFVRRLLMNEAFYRLKKNKTDNGIIMTTDGDTRVAPDWIAQNIKEIAGGADAVGGRILLEASELEQMDKRARYLHLLDEEYRLLVAEFECVLDRIPHDVFPRHHQHFNGSFAVTTRAFEQAGGVPEVEFLEDVAFYHALLRVDAKVRHSPRVKVFTSGRNVGRSQVGLSFQINKWTEMGKNNVVYSVESAVAIEKRMLTRKRLRSFWEKVSAEGLPTNDEIASLAQNIKVPAEWLSGEIGKRQTFGKLLENVFRAQDENAARRKQNPFLPIEQAVSDLQKRLKELRRESAVTARA